MSKVLLISSRDVFRPGGELNLMATKANKLNESGFKTLVLSFRLKGKFEGDFETQPFQMIENKSLKDAMNWSYFSDVLKNNTIDIIQFSGIWTYLIWYLHRKKFLELGISISLDYQGCLEELYEYSKGPSKLLKKVLYFIFKKLEKTLYLDSQIIEVVSNNCIEHLKFCYGETKAKFVIVPCNVNALISYENYQLYRKFYREKYNIQDGEISLVYSGGVSPWQNLNELAAFAKKGRYRVFIFSASLNSNVIKEIFKNCNYEHLSIAVEELNKALCAFDFGVLFRCSNYTNFVAYPNKFAEYYNARLTTLVTSKDIGFYSSFSDYCLLIQDSSSVLSLDEVISKPSFNISRISMDKLVLELSNEYKCL